MKKGGGESAIKELLTVKKVVGEKEVGLPGGDGNFKLFLSMRIWWGLVRLWIYLDFQSKDFREYYGLGLRSTYKQSLILGFRSPYE